MIPRFRPLPGCPRASLTAVIHAMHHPDREPHPIESSAWASRLNRCSPRAHSASTRRGRPRSGCGAWPAASGARRPRCRTGGKERRAPGAGRSDTLPGHGRVQPRRGLIKKSLSTLGCGLDAEAGQSAQQGGSVRLWEATGPSQGMGKRQDQDNQPK